MHWHVIVVTIHITQAHCRQALFSHENVDDMQILEQIYKVLIKYNPSKEYVILRVSLSLSFTSSSLRTYHC